MDRKGTKQETLEEAAETYSENWEDITGLDYENCVPSEINKIDFKSGAEWQQEQDKNKFSEEDMKQAFFDGIRVTGEGYNGEYASGNSPDIEVEFYESYTEWFNKFKKNKDNEL
jgi:hypothetical protein